MSDVVVIQAGDDDDVTLSFPEAAPGMTAYAQVRAYPTGPVLYTWSTTDGSLIVGDGVVTLVVVDSSTWTWRSGEFDIRLDTGTQTEVSGPYRVRVRTLLSGGDPGSNYLTAAHNTDPSAHPDIRALIGSGGTGGPGDGGTDTPDATTTVKGKSVLLGGTADNPTVPYGKVTGAPTTLPPSGGAGGVLSGNYPNPGFAVDMTTQAEHYAHVNDSGNPHGVTKAQVGLGSVANLAPADLPVSNATADALEEVESSVPTIAAQGIAAAVSAHNSDPAGHADLRAALDAVATSIPEQARDALGSALVAGSNVTITPNDGADTITISVTIPPSYSDEQAQDAVAALIAAGTHSGISFAYNDAGNALSATVAFPVSSVAGKTGAVTLAKGDVGLGNVDNTSDASKPVSTAQQSAINAVAAAVPEQARDAVGAALVAGQNVTITADDAADTITIAVNIPASGYGDEQAQDATAALFGAGTHTGVTFTYDDAGNAISAAVQYGTTATTAARGNDSRLSDTRTPTDASVTDAKVAPSAGIAESKLNLASDAVPGTASRRTLGTGAQQAAAGNDSRIVGATARSDMPAALLRSANLASDGDLESGTSSNWYAFAGPGGTNSFTGVSSSAAYRGGYGFRLVWGTAPTGSGGGVYADAVNVLTPGQTYSFGIYLRAARNITVDIAPQWRDSSNNNLGTASTSSLSLIANQWARATFVGLVAPAGAVGVRMTAFGATGQTWASGDILDADDFTVVLGFVPDPPDATVHQRGTVRLSTIDVRDFGVVADGVADDTVALQRAINIAVRQQVPLRITPGRYKITAGLTAALDGAHPRFYCDATGASIEPTSNTSYNAVTIGGNDLSLVGNPFNAQAGRWIGGTIVGPTANPNDSNHYAAFKLNGTLLYLVSGLTVNKYDVGIDMIRNCFGTRFEDCRIGFGATVNVGVNFRGAVGDDYGAGNDIVFDNCWVSGMFAGYLMAPDSTNLRVRGGQFNAVRGTDNTAGGALVWGLNYNSGATGDVGHVTVTECDLEGSQHVYELRGYGRGGVTVENSSIFPVHGDGQIGVLYAVNPYDSVIVLRGNEIKGTFSTAQLATVTGTVGPGFRLYEDNWSTQLPTMIAGVAQSITSGPWMTGLATQSGLTAGTVEIGRSAVGSSIKVDGRALRRYSVVFREATRDSGDVNVTWTAKAAVDSTGALDLIIPAAATEVIEVVRAAQASNEANPMDWDIRVVDGSGGTIRDLGGFGTLASMTIRGGDYFGASGVHAFTVQAGDIVGGNIRLRLLVKIGNPGSRTVFAATGTTPLRWWAKNFGVSA